MVEQPHFTGREAEFYRRYHIPLSWARGLSMTNDEIGGMWRGRIKEYATVSGTSYLPTRESTEAPGENPGESIYPPRGKGTAETNHPDTMVAGSEKKEPLPTGN